MPNLRDRPRGEAGFTLVELLVVVVIIGALAAISIPSFLDQTAKADDVEAKALAISAAKALESCATSDNGAYEDCSSSALSLIDPTLNNADGRLSITAGTNAYAVQVTAKRDGGAVTYAVTRESSGATRHTCSTGAAPRGGCTAQTGGEW